MDVKMFLFLVNKFLFRIKGFLPFSVTTRNFQVIIYMYVCCYNVPWDTTAKGLLVTPYVTSKCNNNPIAVTGRRLSLTITEKRNNINIDNIKL